MHENNFITESICKASSLKRYAVRMKKDACLQDDVGHFMLHHSQSLSRLVDKLMSNDFVRERLCDPYYPM
jgi:hypothetical protein